MLNLIIVGVAKSGKTSLVKKLSQLRRQNLPNDELNICTWKFFPTTNDGNNVYFRTWDFPSQVSIYVIAT